MKQAFTLLAGIFGGFAAAGVVLLMLSPQRGEAVTLLPPPTLEPYHVHICGAVATPGVYQFEPGTIAADAITAAGGFTNKADTTDVNLASAIHDGQKLFIPYLQPTDTAVNEAGQHILVSSGLININQASAPDLERLPGIGPVTAKKIIEYREMNGPFLSVEDLMNVPGIGPAKLEQIHDLVAVY